MEFCPVCGTVLLPKRHKNLLHCRVCEEDIPFVISKKELNEYKSRVRSKNKNIYTKALKTAIINENDSKNDCSEEDRETYEDLFILNEESGNEE